MAPGAPSPLAIADSVARNVAPLAGVLLLGWFAPGVLALYFVDTMLGMVVILAALVRVFSPAPAPELGPLRRVGREIKIVLVALVTGLLLGVPLGGPVLILLIQEYDGATMFADPMFRAALAWQAIAAFWSGRSLYRALAGHTPEKLRIRHRFTNLFLRWIAVVMVAFLGAAIVPANIVALLLVAVYAAATVLIEVAPARFARLMGGADVDAPFPGSLVEPLAGRRAGPATPPAPRPAKDPERP